MKQQEAKRRKLREEIKWGFFGDVKEYQKTKGKLFSAEKDLINSVEAPLFPKFEAKSITGKKIVFPDLLKGKCSLLSIVSRDISMPLSKSFCDPFWEEFGEDEEVTLYELSLVQGYWRVFLPLFKHFFKVEMPINRKKNFIVESPGTLLEALFIRNPCFNYIFLTDKKGRIRWKASGKATEEELNNLFSFVPRILGRNYEKTITTKRIKH